MNDRKPVPQKQIFLRIEDEDAFDGGIPAAFVPVLFTESKRKIEGECSFGAYPILRDFLYTHKNSLFSRAALADLDEALVPYLQKIGYERGGGRFRFYRSFVLWDKRKLNTSVILPSATPLDRRVARSVKVNQTGFDLCELLSKRLETVVAVENGELLSVASVNEHSPGQRLLELTVYTRPSARGRGLASSCAAKLCEMLFEKKKGAVYVCSCRNAPSVALARKIGLQSDARFYAVDAYKIEE